MGFEIRTNGRHKKLLEIQIVLAGSFEIQSSKSPDFKSFWITNGPISDPHCMKFCFYFDVFVLMFLSPGVPTAVSDLTKPSASIFMQVPKSASFKCPLASCTTKNLIMKILDKPSIHFTLKGRLTKVF